MTWTVGKKLGFIFMIIMLVVAVISTAGIVSSYELNQNSKEINTEIIPKLESINALEKQTQKVFDLSQRHILSKDREFEERYEKEIDSQFEKIDQILISYGNLLKDKNEKKLLEKITAEWNSFSEQTYVILESSRNNQDELAIQQSYEAIINLDNIEGQLGELNNLHTKEAKAIERHGIGLYKNVVLILVIFSVLALLISILVSRYLLRSMKDPIVLLSWKFKQLAAGDLTIEKAAIKSSDEIGELGENFNSMLVQLKEMVTALHDHIGTVADTSIELSASAEETSKASVHITESVIEISEGASQQLERSHSSYAVAEEITSGMSQAAASVQSVSDLAVSTADRTAAGSSLMETAIGKMAEIKFSTESTAGAVNELNEKSARIGKIVAVINGIAEQTNLLALNAAIEAARAGEHGKGFAVVAEEVRKLAEGSGVAAREIVDVIGLIQEDVSKATAAMASSQIEVAQGLILIHESGQSFKDISKMVDEVAAQAQEISAITEEITASTHDLKKMANEVAHMSEVAEDRTQNVAAAVEQQNAIMEEISASSTVLSSMSENLKEMVSHFKIR